MAKSFPIVALLLIVAVLGGGQCADLCALRTCHRPASSSASLPPCHRTPQKQQPEPACAHRELVAEQQVNEAVVDPIVPVPQVAATVSVAALPELGATAWLLDAAHYPLSYRTPLKTILRI